MKIVVKVGTQSILSKEGVPLLDTIRSIASQIIRLIQDGHNVIFVSSGAVGLGRGIAKKYLKNESIQKQILASVGQHELMHIYSKIFMEHNFLASQILLTKQDFQTREGYLNIASILREALSQSFVIPIINENDSVAPKDLMFTDNDELAGLVAAQINADKLIILSNIEGVYTGNPELEDSILIPIIDPNEAWPNVSSDKNTLGRGGMRTKLSNAKKMSNLGITTHIASINQDDVLGKIVRGESIGTTINILSNKSNIKKWLAYSVPSGKIYINDRFCNILKTRDRAISLLPVGIESFSTFEKGDVLEILSKDEEFIGIGVAKYNSNTLKDLIGQKNKPELVHHDYLYIV